MQPGPIYKGQGTWEVNGKGIQSSAPNRLTLTSRRSLCFVVMSQKVFNSPKRSLDTFCTVGEKNNLLKMYSIIMLIPKYPLRLDSRYHNWLLRYL